MNRYESTTRRGFTLIEVGIALLILVVACLSILMLLPKALQIQQESRMKILASIHVQSLVAGFMGHDVDLIRQETAWTPSQGKMFPYPKNWMKWTGNYIDPWTRPELAMRESRWLQAKGEFDLERLMSQANRGNYPVPIEIAQRLDSPGDEIRQIVSSGGYVYYTDGNGGDPNLGKNQPLSRDTSDQVKLIWGVVGPPQQNLLPFNPMAYQQVETYPHPPQARARPVDRVWHFSKNLGYEYVTSYIKPVGTDVGGGVLLTLPVTVEVWRPSSGKSTLEPVISTWWYPGGGGGYPLDYGFLQRYDVGGGTWSHDWDSGHPWMYQRNTWEWYARVAYDLNGGGGDPKWFDPSRTNFNDFTPANDANAAKLNRNPPFERLYSANMSFLTSIDAFRELSLRHWLRIVAQTDEISAQIATAEIPPVYWGGSSGQWVQTGTENYTDWRVKVLGGMVCRDSMGNVVYEPYTLTRPTYTWVPGVATGGIGGGTIQEILPGSTADTGVLQWKDVQGDGRYTVGYDSAGIAQYNGDFCPNFWVGISQGYTQPAQGLGYSRLRGSDILYEDAVLVGPQKMLKEVLQSLPSLERRVKYRTAALILWAKVAYNLDIRHIEDPTLAYVEPESGSAPTVPANSGRAYLPRNRNPLYNWQNLDGFLSNGMPITDISTWHPTQILAINYLAHAAMMCTGYKAPFYRDKNSTGIDDDELMVQDEGNNPLTGLAGALPLNNELQQKKWQWASSYGSNHDELPYRSLTNTAMEEGVFNPNTKQWNLLPALGVGVEPARSPANAWRDPRDGAADTISNWYVQVLTALTDGSDRQLISLSVDPITGYLIWPAAYVTAGRRIVICDRNRDGALSSNELYDPASNPVLVWDNGCNYYIRNPYCLGLLPNTQALEHAGFSTRQETVLPQDFQTYALPAVLGRDLTGRGTQDVPIGYRPKSSDILNPFPPPYADKGAFDAGGNRVHRVTWQLTVEEIGAPETSTSLPILAPRLLRKIRRTDYNANYAGRESLWARNAHEAMMRIVMHYKANYPYDNTVPLPANRQIFTDRGIWQKDLFDAGGNARRPQALSVTNTRANAYYPFTAPVLDTTDGLRWSMAFAIIASVDTPNQFGESIEWKYRWADMTSITRSSVSRDNICTNQAGRYRLGDRLPMLRSGDGYNFGAAEMGRKTPLNNTNATSILPTNSGCNGYYDRDHGWVHTMGRKDEKAAETRQPLLVNVAIAQTLKDWGYVNPAYPYTENGYHWRNDMNSNSPVKRNYQGTSQDYSEPKSSSIPKIENPARCTAVRQFTPSQRCRQLVYWSADWMQYEDFESAPSAPIDWSMMPMYSYGSYSNSAIWLKPLTGISAIVPGPGGTITNDPTSGPFLRNVATIWEAIIWAAPGMQVDDQLTLELNGVATAVKISNASLPPGTGNTWKPYWVKAVDSTLDFRNTLFYTASKMPIREAVLTYDAWATSTGNPLWSAGPSDAKIFDWYGQLVTSANQWWVYQVDTTLRIWNSGTPTKTGEGGPSEYRYTWSSPYRVHTLSSLDRTDIQIMDINDGNIASGVGKTYSLASKKGDICRGVPAEAFLTTTSNVGTLSIDSDNSVSAEAIAYNPFIMTGAFGADRNHDGVFTKGPIKRSDRLRAEFIARFNYYDPIAWICLGQ